MLLWKKDVGTEDDDKDM